LLQKIIMNDILNVIYERRSVRKYKEQPVEKSMIDQIIAAGSMAPSAMNLQPWKFYIVTDITLIKSFSKAVLKIAAKQLMHLGITKLIKSALSSFHFGSVINFVHDDDPVFHHAPVVIFIAGPKDDEWAAMDIGMWAQNIMLAAKSLGLDTCPVGFGKFIENTDAGKILSILPAEQIYLSITLGYGDETPELHKRKKGNVVYITA
jgi:nitroreductase